MMSERVDFTIILFSISCIVALENLGKINCCGNHADFNGVANVGGVV